MADGKPPERFASFDAKRIKGGYKMVCKLLPKDKDKVPESAEAKIEVNRLTISASVNGKRFEDTWDAREQSEILKTKKNKGEVSVKIKGIPSDEIAERIHDN